MRRLLLTLVALAVVASVVAAPGQSAKTRSLSFTVALVQEATTRHPHPPAGNAGDTFSTELRLFTIVTTLGVPPKTPIGTMAFNWGPLKGSCGTSVAGCSGFTPLMTVTRLPGGTITAGGQRLNLAKGEIAPVLSGTGAFKGVRGNVTFLVQQKEGVFSLTVPA